MGKGKWEGKGDKGEGFGEGKRAAIFSPAPENFPGSPKTSETTSARDPIFGFSDGGGGGGARLGIGKWGNGNGD